MTITNTYRRLKYLVVSLLFLICSNHEVKADLLMLPLIIPSYSITGNDISINCNIIKEPNWRKMAYERNWFNFQIRNGYIDPSGRTQNLVSYLGVYEFIFGLLLRIPEKIYPQSIEYLEMFLLLGNLVSNSKYHYYWHVPEVKPKKLDWYCTNFIGINTAIYQGENINPIYSFRPELGIRLGLQKILNQYNPGSGYSGNHYSNALFCTERAKAVGMYLDFGYRYSFDFQNGSKPDGIGNIFISFGFCTSWFDNF